MACGTGKTLVGPFLAELMAVKSVLVLVPSLSLLGQTLREWATAVEFDYLAVCSDETVTKNKQDAVVASTTELGIPVTTDAARIARFLRRRGEGTKVVFSTYRILAADRASGYWPGHRKTPCFQGSCEADERARTVDLLHGKQTLYQLSYIREGAEYSRDYESSFSRRSGTTSSGSG